MSAPPVEVRTAPGPDYPSYDGCGKHPPRPCACGCGRSVVGQRSDKKYFDGGCRQKVYLATRPAPVVEALAPVLDDQARAVLEALAVLGERVELCYEAERGRPPLPVYAEALVVSLGGLDVATFGFGTTGRGGDYRTELKAIPTLELHPRVLIEAAALARRLLQRQ